jgi:hypothetical protein
MEPRGPVAFAVPGLRQRRRGGVGA